MTIRELAEKCEERDENCDGCPYTRACENMSEHTPASIIRMVKNNEDTEIKG